MLKPTCIALAVTALVFGFGELAAQAGWINAAPSLAGAKAGPSLVLQVKKKKKDDEDDNGGSKQEKAKHKGKNKNNQDNNQETTESSPLPGGGGKATTPSSSNSNSSSGTLLLPYFECDLTKSKSCPPPKQQ
jgi:hypothetical protein